MIDPGTAYLIIHGVTTVGALIVFLQRAEQRMTKMETKLEMIEKYCLDKKGP